MKSKTIAFHHFGCKVNFAEASSLSRQFQVNGFEIAGFHDLADIYVISTCVVTAVAEKKCRAAIRQAHKINPGARIAVIGCFSELKPGELAKMEGVDLVLGHTGKFQLLEELTKLDQVEEHINEKPAKPNQLHEAVKHDHDYHGGISPTSKTSREIFVPSFSYGDRTRSFLKIQDGCDYYCSYCTIPLARGNSRSDTIGNTIKNAREIIGHGVNEIVLTGVNIGDFGKQNGESFDQLIRELDQVEGMSRVRISSIEPDLLTNEIIEFVATSANFMPHFHIPLQSGSNRILKAMHRRYNRELYAERITKIRSLMPHACIAADVITGFPGETDEDFNITCTFLEQLGISYLHVFTYSKRDNTPAAKMEALVPDKIKKERSDRLHYLSEDKKRQFYLQNQGKEVQVLFESNNSNGFMHGFSENYIKVKTKYNSALVNQVVRVKLDNIADDGNYIV
jgi:threonylcarbamoyladenosine tRNA methylthiotransferase MtaB